jgi:hypothetical protein
MPASYGAPNKPHFRERCGAPITYDYERNRNQVDLYVASLDNPNAIAPTCEVRVAERVAWFKTEDAPRYVRGRAAGLPIRHGPRQS